MAQEVIVGQGLWSDPPTWQDGTVPESSNGLQITSVDTGGSIEDLGTASNPFVVDRIDFGLTGRVTVVGNLDAHKLSGGQVSVFSNNSSLKVDDASNMTLIIAGNANITIGHKFDGSNFRFAPVSGTETIILEHPPLKFIHNFVDFSETSFRQGTSEQRIELPGLTFDKAEFSTPITLTLSNKGVAVAVFDNVSASTSATLSVGIDPINQNHFVSYIGHV